MGTVINLPAGTLHQAAPATPTAYTPAEFQPFATQPEAPTVDSTYEVLRTKAGLRARPQQQVLSEAVKEAFETGVPLLAEAPTGTGKTIAYLVGGLLAKQAPGASETPIVVATATVALQEQLLTGDIPRLVAGGLVDKNRVVVAKGRGRYFCLKAALKLNEGSVSQLDIFDQAVNEKAEDLAGLDDMLTSYDNDTWDGDIDRWKHKQPVFWAKVQANSDTCTKSKCDKYDDCAFFRARNALFNARVVVANHDLVLSDLAQAAQENEPVLPYTRYYLVIDEAHHLPDKAVEQGRSSCEMNELVKTLQSIASWAEAVMKQPVAARYLSKLVAVDTLENTSPVQHLAGRVKAELLKLQPDTENLVQFGEDEIPEPLLKANDMLGESLVNLREELYEALRHLKSDKLAERLGPQASAMLPLQVSGSSLLNALKEGSNAVKSFSNPDIPVKWIDLKEGATLCTSPLDGNEVLEKLLWKSKRAVPALVSATIKDFEGFDRFVARTGAPELRKELTVAPVLPYHKAVVRVPYMDFTPRQAERLKFEEELCSKLCDAIDLKGGGSLVLAPSWKLMERLKLILKKKFGLAVLAQGSLPTKELVAEHKRRIDAGRPSILVGVASLSEGLDLPGSYCTHVLIAALPFSSPTDPVEKERARLAGKNYFSRHSLPDALVKLVQMAGRLIRREDDHGTITVFDMRLRSTGFGRKMLKALPGYQIDLPPGPPKDEPVFKTTIVRKTA